MAEIRMTGEIRTDYDCEINGLPAELWRKRCFGSVKKRLSWKSVSKKMSSSVLWSEKMSAGGVPSKAKLM